MAIVPHIQCPEEAGERTWLKYLDSETHPLDDVRLVLSSMVDGDLTRHKLKQHDAVCVDIARCCELLSQKVFWIEVPASYKYKKRVHRADIRENVGT